MEITRSRYSYSQRPTKSPKRRRLAAWLFVLVLLLSGGGYTAAAFAKDLPTPTLTTVALVPRQAEPVSLAWPSVGQAAVGSLTDGVLARSSETEQARPIASMTKIVTALAVLEKAPLAVGEQGKTYALTERDRSLYASYLAKDGSVVPVIPGQTITHYQAMQALLLASANNIADTLVLEHFGSMEAYILYANQMVAGWGLTNTVIKDASGFSPQTVSTPSELISLGQRAMRQPALAAIMAQKEATIPGIGLIRNTNRLLGESGVIGLKTGTTDEAGSCLLFAATHRVDETYSVTVIGVVMGAASAATVFRDAKSLLASTFPQFVKTTVIPAGTVAGTIASPWGQQTRIITESELVTYSWKGSAIQTQTVTEAINDANIASGQELGSVAVVGTNTKVRLVAEGAITEPSNLWRLKNYL